MTAGQSSGLLGLGSCEKSPLSRPLSSFDSLDFSRFQLANLKTNSTFEKSQIVTSCLRVEKKSASDAHGHDDVAVAVAFIGERTHLSRRLFVLQLDADGAVGGCGEKIEHVAGIKADGDGIAFVFLVDRFLGFTVFGARSGNF